jgi:hypothetical protein
MVEKTLLLEKVKANKIELIDTNVYKLTFNIFNNKAYIVFITKESVDKNLINLDDSFDVVKVDRYRDNEEYSNELSIFNTGNHLQYSSVHSYLTIEPNHTDPARFHLLM